MRKLLFVVLLLLACATLVVAQEPIYDYFVYLPIASGGAATPTPTPSPVSMTTLYWNNKNMNGYPACYEVLGTGIGQQCRPIGDIWRLYGSFPSGEYKVVYGSSRCRIKSFDRQFRSGEVRHMLACEPSF